MQGAENFKKELEQLRRAFRYDEFETVTAAAAPPKNVVVKAGTVYVTRLYFPAQGSTEAVARIGWLAE